MIKLTGYTITEEIYAGQHSIVYRGVRSADTQAVIIKILNQEYPSEELLSYFRREYEIARKVSGEGTLQVYDLIRYKNTLAIVMEDIGGISLSQIIHSVSMNLSEKLSLAVKIAHSLSLIHKKQIIHKNINPSNIIWNRETDRLEIIDFGIAAELKREMTHQMQHGFMEGTPDYLSPEQTGRINRPVDSRSDLYSLGVTLYEIFTGQLPFIGEDENEIIYSHIARKPKPPHLINKNIPKTVSNILLKLLAKDGEDRYQMASGLQKDLELCLEHILFNSDIIPFEIGRFDISDQLTIPDKLYGRQKELESLTVLFGDVAEGNSALIMIEGYPGIGKSSLVQEFSKFVSLRKGFFISGKFDQQEQNIPLHGALQALHSLMLWLLSLPENQLQLWRKKILEAVPQNAGFLIEMLPELEKVIGVQPPVIELNPIEAHNRFLIVCSDFINLFASAGSPLVIFLDDLQWCDITTLELIKYMVGSSRSSKIMFIGAYRQNELNPRHPLINALEEINIKSHTVQTITLLPLDINEIDQMLADTFRRAADEDTLSLATLIYQKTGGTPFFINQLLVSLFGLGYFELSLEQRKWVWDITRIREVDISDNVIDLLSQKIDELPPSALELLTIASCIGNQFDLDHLSMICKRPAMEIGNTLWSVVQNEIIYPLNQNYKLMRLTENDSSLSAAKIRFAFQHNRIQQLIYSRIPEQDRQAIHLEIGREYALHLKNHEASDFLFNMVNHMNKGRSLIKDLSERIVLRDLNTQVGSRAMKSTAFSVAADYFSITESLLSHEEWKSDHKGWFRALLNLGEALFLSGELTRAEEICERMFYLSDEAIDQAKVHNLKARLLEFQGRIPETVEEIRKGLRVLDIILPEEDEDIGRRIGEGIMLLLRTLASGPIESLADLPLMADQNKIQAMELLYNVIPPALQFRPSLYVLSSLMMFELTLNFGVTSFSCKSFVDVGITQSPSLNDFSIGYRLGKTAFRLLDRLNAESMKPAVYFGFTFASFRNAHFQEALQYYDMAYTTGLQTGDIQHAAYARAHKLHLYMQVGKNLVECEGETENTILFLNEVKAGMPLLLATIIQYMLKKYRSEEEIDEDGRIISTIEQTRNIAFLWRFYQYNTVFNYMNNQWKQAEKWCQLTDQFIFAAQSDFPRPEHLMLKALIIVRLWDDFTEEEKPSKMTLITESMEELEKTALLCPSNFSHKFHFLSAEVAILKKAPQEEVLDQYNKALASLKEDDFIHMKALIYESMAGYWQRQENEIISRAYITEAYFYFKKWGALRKVRLMEEEYPNLRKHFSESRTSSPHRLGLTSDSIDMTSILKAMQVISGEIRFEKLLRSLMSLILENAGARQGALLLVNSDDKELYIEAEKKTFEDEIEIMQSLPYRKSSLLCPEIIQYVSRSLENVVLGNAWKEGEFRNNPHIKDGQIKSVLSVPIIYQNRLVGVIYLEHDLAEDVFTEDQIQTLKILSSQAAISIENARLYESLEKKVDERTAQLNQANEKLRQLSLHDPLTALHNRRYVSEFVSELSMNFIIRKVQLLEDNENMNISINQKVFGVFMIDLDHFKMVNDTYGHSAGDTVLVRISRALAKQIRADDFVVRWGGEEFLIILNKTNPEYLDVFARKILKAISETPLQINADTTLYKTCSIGYCTLPLHTKVPDLLNLEQTINLSDFAMYLAKEKGRNCAARINMNQQTIPSLECKEYLHKLSKNDSVRAEFIDVSYVENPKE
jgi:diguanylate cyclase (GGDEF)-like protein